MKTKKTKLIKQLLWLAFYSLPLVAFAANLTEPRAAAVSQPKTQSPSLPPKVIIYKHHFARPAGALRDQNNPEYSRNDGPAPQAVKAYVQTQALEHRIDPRIALWIVRHESQFNPRAKGDGEASRGLWQISRIYHPEVSDAMAFSVASSTEWSLERIREGKVNEWSTYRFCRTLYPDCPF
jgi:hypothetical protein